MPIYEVKCNKCGDEKEVLTLSANENLPKCPCGGKLSRLMPSKVTWRWAYSEGSWEQVGGTYKYRGPGGKKQIMGGEKLDVHEGLPVMAEETLESKQEPDTDDYFDEVAE